jgi:AAHS family 3-hydroxyphenylpropionic acid transporter
MAVVAAASGRAAYSPALVVAICCAIAALEGYDIQAVGVAAPAMAPSLRLGDAQIGLAGSWSMVGLVLGAFVGGWLADRVGRKPVLVVSVAWFGICSVATSMVQSGDLLLATRFLTGLGFGGAMPNMIAIASEISAPQRRAITVTAIFVGMPAGGALAALVTRFLPHGFDWRLIFLMGGVFPLALAPITLLWLPETRPDPGRQGDRRALTALFGGGRTLATLCMWTAFAFTLVVLYLMLGWLPLLVVAKGLGRDAGSLAALAFNLVGVAGGIAIGLLADRHRFRWPLAATYVGLAIGMALLALANQVGQVLVLSAVVGFCVIGTQYGLYALAPLYYPPAVRGLGAGAAVGAGRMGSIVGPLLAGAMRERHASAAEVLGVTLPVIVVAALAAFVLTFLKQAEEV